MSGVGQLSSLGHGRSAWTRCSAAVDQYSASFGDSAAIRRSSVDAGRRPVINRQEPSL